MRRRLALLVVATTSVVLLAFLVPLAVLVSRAAASQAVNEATSRTQVVVSAAASGAGPEELAALTDGLARLGLDVTVVARPTAPRATTVTRVGGDALVRQPVAVDGRLLVVETVVPKARLTRGVTQARLVLLMLGVVLVGLSLLVAERLARSITAPMTDLATTTRRLGDGDLDARVVPRGPGEVREVGLAVNKLAARIRELLVHERESVADLSHRLRTPVTALRLDVEALRSGPDRDRLTADVDELSRTVDALIREARRPVREGVAARCDATEVVRERVEFWRALAEDQGRVLSLTLPERPAPVRADGADLRAALDALLGNVFAHTADGVSCSVGLAPAERGGVVLDVLDSGPGFPDRTVVARGRSGAGSTGLGLDIARRTAEASGGSLDVGAGPDGRGARVTLRLGPPAAGARATDKHARDERDGPDVRTAAAGRSRRRGTAGSGR